MCKAKKTCQLQLGVKRIALILAAGWTLLMAGLCGWEWQREMEDGRELARNECRTHFLKDQAFRYWASAHGGVYVPSNDRTPPNPYLAHIPDRDIETTTGKKLTLMNPAYMVRQLMQDFDRSYGVKGHITSLKPLRPENGPDDWERMALQSIEKGAPEVQEFVTWNGKSWLRLMGAMKTEASCLKCHGQQGYQVGDIRGGVSVAVPADDYLAEAWSTVTTHSGIIGIIWLFGLAGLGVSSSALLRREQERDRAIEEIRRLAAVTEQTSEGIAVADLDGIVQYANLAWAAMHGYATGQELAGVLLSQFHTPEQVQTEVNPFNERVKQQGHNTGEMGHCRRDGSVFSTFMNVTLLKDEQGVPYAMVAIAQDITRLKQAGQEREFLLQTLESRNNELQSIVRVASHDLRSPLVTISGFGGMLANQCQTLGSLVQEAVLDEDKTRQTTNLIREQIPGSLHFITAAINKMQMLLDGLLQVSRAGSAELTIEPLDMNEMLRQVVEAAQFKINERGVRVTVDALPGCRGDLKKTNQVFSNLIDNALKYLDSRRPGTIHVSGRTQGNMSLYCVEDNGIGIAANQIDRIFEVFYRINPGDAAGGDGLGLSIIQRVLDRLNGHIRVESELGKGSQFFVSLPGIAP